MRDIGRTDLWSHTTWKPARGPHRLPPMMAVILLTLARRSATGNALGRCIGALATVTVQPCPGHRAVFGRFIVAGPRKAPCRLEGPIGRTRLYALWAGCCEDTVTLGGKVY